jgi:hypothetical protein
MAPRMSQRRRPFMVGASEEIGSQQVEDPRLLGWSPLTGSLRQPLPMGGSHPVVAQPIGESLPLRETCDSDSGATGAPAIVVSVWRAS